LVGELGEEHRTGIRNRYWVNIKNVYTNLYSAQPPTEASTMRVGCGFISTVFLVPFLSDSLMVTMSCA
jgi:hypothetical protein